MKKKSVSHDAFFNVRILIFVALFTISAIAMLFAVSGNERSRRTPHIGGIKRSAGAGTAQWVWQKPLPQGNPLNGVSFTDANIGTLVGEGGTILRTTDGGAHWTIQTSGYEGTGVSFAGVSFTDANIGMAAGANPSTGGAAVVRTTDGGNTWATKYTNPAALLFWLSFTHANTRTVVWVDFFFCGALIFKTPSWGV